MCPVSCRWNQNIWTMLAKRMRQRVRLLSVTRQRTFHEYMYLYVNMTRQIDSLYIPRCSKWVQVSGRQDQQSDVVVVASIFPSLYEFGLMILWVDYGQGGYFRWISIRSVCNGVREVKWVLFFHTFAWCDVVSMGMADMDCVHYVSRISDKLSQYPATADDEDIWVLEGLFVLINDRSGSNPYVTVPRLDLFARKHMAWVDSTNTGSY